MNCECVERVNEGLAVGGVDYRVATAFVFSPNMSDGRELLQIETYYPGPARRGRKKPPGIICTYCPFCGVRTSTATEEIQ